MLLLSKENLMLMQVFLRYTTLIVQTVKFLIIFKMAHGFLLFKIKLQKTQILRCKFLLIFIHEIINILELFFFFYFYLKGKTLFNNFFLWLRENINIVVR